MKQLLFFVMMTFFLMGCKKEAVRFSTDANEVFWLSNAGADMPVWVKGNTASKVMILFLHGGPGSGSYRYAGFQTDQLWKNYSFAYWDQRDAGAAAGNSNYSNLNLPQMINDLQKLVTVIKYRYGNDMEIFLMGHSFGALLGCGYLVEGDNQKNIRGWIEVDGAHDYPQSYTLEHKMLIDTGWLEIAKNHYEPEWTNILDYCFTHPANTSLDNNDQLDDYAADAENYVSINHATTATDLFSQSSPVSFGINLLYLNESSAGRQFQESLQQVSFTPMLYKITIPSLLIWGQYDFTVPLGCGKQALENLGSSYKQLVVMPHSGHVPMNGDPELFAQTVAAYIEAVR